MFEAMQVKYELYENLFNLTEIESQYKERRIKSNYNLLYFNFQETPFV